MEDYISNLYYIWDTEKSTMAEQRVFQSYDAALNLLGRLTGYDLRPLSNYCEIREKPIREKCVCDDFINTPFILIRRSTDRIEVVTINNYVGIFNTANIPIDCDIDSTYPGYELMMLNYFHTNFTITKN